MNQKLNLKLIGVSIIFLAILAVFFIPLPKENSSQKANATAIKGNLAPNFTLLNLSGKKVTLSSFKGKVVLLNFWATWCYPCSMEIPSMELLYKKFKKLNFQMLAVKVKDKPFGSKIVDEKDIKFPVLLDNSNKVSMLYGLTGVPESFIIDKKGYIVERIAGAFDWSQPKVINYLKKLIEKK